MIAAKRHNIFKLKIGSRPVEEDVAHVLAIKKPWVKTFRSVSMSTVPGQNWKPLKEFNYCKMVVLI